MKRFTVVLLCAVFVVVLINSVYGNDQEQDKYSNSGSESSDMPLKCSDLSSAFLNCTYNSSCVLGSVTTVVCHPLVPCEGSKTLSRDFICQQCYQTPDYMHNCTKNNHCPNRLRSFYIANCTVPDKFLCLGSRHFQKQLNCSVFSSKSETVLIALSLFVGSYAVDRFYLGHVGWGILKMLTFGGAGIWVIVDFFFAVTGSAKPSGDGVFRKYPPNKTLWTYKGYL